VLRRLAVVLTFAVAAAGCATAAPDAPKADAGVPRQTPFESWSAGNGTGAFFGPVGPAGGSGVRWAWPQ